MNSPLRNRRLILLEEDHSPIPPLMRDLMRWLVHRAALGRKVFVGPEIMPGNGRYHTGHRSLWVACGASPAGDDALIWRAGRAHMQAPGCWATPAIEKLEVVPLFGRSACLRAPFSISISSACRPTIRSRAAILASYS